MTDSLIEHNVALLTDLAEMIESPSFQQVYQTDHGCQAGATIGAHIRHLLEHYQLFTAELAAMHLPLQIDYDARKRCPQLEGDGAAALAAIDRLLAGFSQLKEQKISADMPVSVACSTDCGSAAQWVSSTLGRELQFLHSHAVHHLALVKLTAREYDIDLVGDVGVAPSTLKHRRSQKQPSQQVA